MTVLPGAQKAGGVAATGHPQPTPGLIEVAVDGMLGDAEAAGDFLGVQVIGDQPEALALARCQPFYRRRVVVIPHEGDLKAPGAFRPYPLSTFEGDGSEAPAVQAVRLWKAVSRPTGRPHRNRLTLLNATSGEISVKRVT